MKQGVYFVVSEFHSLAFKKVKRKIITNPLLITYFLLSKAFGHKILWSWQHQCLEKSKNILHYLIFLSFLSGEEGDNCDDMVVSLYSSFSQYGNIGCRVFKGGIQN